MIRKILTAIFLAMAPATAFAQSNPNLTYGQVPTAAQWNSYFSSKEDVLAYTPVNKAGDIMTGELITAASTASVSGINVAPGAAPSSPSDGDLWITSSSIFARINGSTVDLVGGACLNCALTNFANIFTAQQTAQGLTTTQPGWFVQVTGDTVPRVHLGLTTGDVPTMSFGSGSGTRDAFIQRVGVANLRHGGPDAAVPVTQTISVQNVLSGTSNIAGATLTIMGSRGTGTGVGGSIVLQTAPAGSSGSTQNALSAALTIFGTGGLASGAATDPGAGNLNLAGGSLLNNGTAPTGTGAYVRAISPTFTGTLTAAALIASGTTTLNSTLTYGGVTLNNLVTGTGNMALSISPTFTGTMIAATISPTTINAYTLGGTISGGGNNINNVNIGVSSPGTSAFSSITDTSIAGSSQCVQANTSGLFSGTGSLCGGTNNSPNGPDLFYNATVQVDQTWEGGTAFCDGSNNPHTIAAGGPANPSRATETYGPDGWRIGCDTGTGIFTSAQVTSASLGNPVPGITNWLHLVVTTADASATATNNYHLEIPVEGPRVAQLKYGTASAVSLTCQFQFSSSINGTYPVTAVEGNANSLSQVATFSYAGSGAAALVSFTYTPFTTGTWVLTPGQFSFKLIFDLGSGSNFETSSTFTPVAGLKIRTPGSVKFIATNGAVINMSALQCDPGTTPLPFRFKSYQQDLADAEYFYRKTFLRGTAVAQNAGVAGAIGYTVPIAGTTYTGSVLMTWPKMPNVPSLYSFNPSAGNAKWRNNNLTADSGTPAFNAVGMSGALISNPQVVGDALSNFEFVQIAVDGRLGGF